MSTLQARAILAAQRAASRVQGGQIVYRRGSDSAEIDAAFGRSEFTVETSDAMRIEYTDRDFIFPAESLVLGGALTKPQKGDRITEVDGGQVYEVLPVDGKQCYRASDPQGCILRVYTKKVSDG